MNFHELRLIVNQIKRSMRCPLCNGKYRDADIDVIGGEDTGESYFHAFCSACHDGSCIRVDTPNPHQEGQDVRLGSAPRMGHVSTNEVLDMHNFLKGFTGNFDDLFLKEENKNG